jgi:hypothetical protein
VPGPGHKDDVQIPLRDCAVEVCVDEVEARGRAPMAEQAWFHVLGRQRLSEQRIVEQVDPTDRKVIGSTPVSVDSPKLICGEDGRSLDSTSSRQGRFADRHDSTSLKAPHEPRHDRRISSAGILIAIHTWGSNHRKGRSAIDQVTKDCCCERAKPGFLDLRVSA